MSYYYQQDFCGENHRNIDNTTGNWNANLTGPYLEDPEFQAWWVVRYCPYNGRNLKGDYAVSRFLQFYPYIILTLALTLFFIDKIVKIPFNAEEKLDKFYKLLVDNKIIQTNEKDHKILSEGEPKNFDADGGLQEIELRYAFRKNQHFFTSFVLRSFIQMLLSSAVLFYLITIGLQKVEDDEDVHCNVHGYWHECHGIPISIKNIT